MADMTKHMNTGHYLWRLNARMSRGAVYSYFSLIEVFLLPHIRVEVRMRDGFLQADVYPYADYLRSKKPLTRDNLNSPHSIHQVSISVTACNYAGLRGVFHRRKFVYRSRCDRSCFPGEGRDHYGICSDTNSFPYFQIKIFMATIRYITSVYRQSIVSII